MGPRTLQRDVSSRRLIPLVLLFGCASAAPTAPSDAGPTAERVIGTPPFYPCGDTSECVAGTACTNWGSGAAYCRPRCAVDADCAGYPYPGLRCQAVTTPEGDALDLRVCNDGPRTVLVDGDGCRAASSCATCTPRASCGWCGATGTCRAGALSGPSVGACGGAWAWLPSECPTDGAVAPPLDADDATAVDAWVDGGPEVAADAPRDAGLDADARDACAPRCAGRDCGDDGCGGSCGACAFGRSCSATGACSAECTPDCAGRGCGPDGCGGSCGRCLIGSCTAEGACGTGACDRNACSSLECGDAGTIFGSSCSCGTCRGDQRCVAGRCTCGPCPSGTVCFQLACCRPDCTGRACGSNGCGGSCGTCGAGLTCNDGGRCVCVPRCGGRACGSDGCLGSCGTCPSGQSCTADGACCAPSCAGRRCGSNGCGGSCGTCATGQTCDASGQCVTTCARNCVGRGCGTDGCGGSCGTCAAGQTCTSGGSCTGGGTCVDNSHCVTTVSARRGESCGSAASIDVSVRNDCAVAIAIQLCLQRADGTCNCGLDDSVRPGGVMSYYTCASTGRWGYRAGSTAQIGQGCFPTTC